MSAGDASEGKEWRLTDFDYEVPENAERFGYSVGGVTLVGLLLLILTGIIMTFFYTPTVDEARGSVLALSSHPGGLWLRSFHRWTAEAVIFLLILHITRVVFTGSYRGRRTLNWLFGVLLLFVTMGFFFSGTVLKWDQEGYEAYQHAVEAMELVPLVGAALASVITGLPAVARFYATHTLVLPALLLLLLTPHLVLMKLNGLSTLPGESSPRTSSFFHHLKRVLAFSLIVYGVMAFLAALFPASLYPGPYTGVEMTKPPWAFLVLYALEDWIGLKALLVAPVVLLVGLVVIPFIDRRASLSSAARKLIVWGYVFVAAVVIFLIVYVGLTPPVTHLGMD